MYNIVAAIFEVESEGYQALTTLAKNPIMNDTTVLQMALVKRDNGYLKICDSFDSGIHSTNDTLIGGLVGSVIGMLGGPIGMLLMGSYGALAGFKVTIARFDAVVIAEEVEEAQKIQKEMARQTRRQLREARKQERKEKREARREKIKSDFAGFKAKFKKNKE